MEIKRSCDCVLPLLASNLELSRAEVVDMVTCPCTPFDSWVEPDFRFLQRREVWIHSNT